MQYRSLTDEEIERAAKAIAAMFPFDSRSFRAICERANEIAGRPLMREALSDLLAKATMINFDRRTAAIVEAAADETGALVDALRATTDLVCACEPRTAEIGGRHADCELH